MAPIYDTDLAQERWNQNQWSQFALWEKTEQIHKRKRKRTIYLTLLIFLSLCAIPIVLQSFPKWHSRMIATHFAIEMNHIKTLAIEKQSAIAFQFTDRYQLSYVIEMRKSCENTPGILLKTGQLKSSFFNAISQHFFSEKPVQLIDPLSAEQIGIFNLSDHFCFDPLKGVFFPNTTNLIGFAFSCMPIEDKTETSAFFDQISIALIRSELGILSFD